MRVLMIKASCVRFETFDLLAYNLYFVRLQGDIWMQYNSIKIIADLFIFQKLSENKCFFNTN